MRSIVTAAAVAALATFSSIGLAKAAPQPIRRGQLDLSMPVIPPIRPKATVEERSAIRDRMRLAQMKRERKAARLKALVDRGAMLAA